MTDSVFFDKWDKIWSVIAVDPAEVGEWRFEAGTGPRHAFRAPAFLDGMRHLLGSAPDEDLSGWDSSLGDPPRFRSGIAGTVGYGARLAFEHLPDRHGPSATPHGRLGKFEAVCAHHGPSGTLWAFGDLSRTSDWEDRLSRRILPSPAEIVSPPRPGTDDDAYGAMVEEVRSAISRGEVFQANVARRWSGSYRGDPREFYRRVHAINPSPWAGVHRTPHWSLLSNSPELLIRVHGRKAQTRPIAGTHPRGRNEAEDLELARRLDGSLKEKAEHLMLVDLARNDLGRVCRPGTVEVPRLAALEPYSHVWHIVSTVEGAIREGLDAFDVFGSMFPCGTITGAPRIRCMELIDALEPVERGFYTGSLGWHSHLGDAEWNVLIRTATALADRSDANAGSIQLHAGAGIVWDSVPDREAQESAHKAAAWLEALRG